VKVVNNISSAKNVLFGGRSNLNNIKGGGNIFPARVSYTILNNTDYPSVFKDYGEWNSIGGVFFTSVNIPTNNKVFTNDNFALPLFPNNKIFPLKNEIVYIITITGETHQSSLSGLSYYYFQPINIWNNSHHNALPDPIFTDFIETWEKTDYELSQGGNVRKVNNTTKEIELGKFFKEKSTLKNLQPYEGDIFYEGRWGQSIRFSSTNPLAPWGQDSELGEPITIIRNGQYEDTTNSIVRVQTEDINKDISCIYLTGNQKLPINVSSEKYNSFKSKITTPSQYKGEQIILNSGRLIFNTKKDSIFLSSKESISLSSNISLNVDTPETIIDSKNILLGNKDASEPIILGNKFLSDFKKLLESLIKISKGLQSPIGTPAPFTPNLTIPPLAVELEFTSQTILNLIDSYKSNTSKTI
jgi:hypothetical protein